MKRKEMLQACESVISALQIDNPKLALFRLKRNHGLLLAIREALAETEKAPLSKPVRAKHTRRAK